MTVFKLMRFHCFRLFSRVMKPNRLENAQLLKAFSKRDSFNASTSRNRCRTKGLIASKAMRFLNGIASVLTQPLTYSRFIAELGRLQLIAMKLSEKKETRKK